MANNRYQREKELIESGIYDTIKNIVRNGNCDISDKYIMLIADYIDSIDEVKDSLMLDPVKLAQTIPSLLKCVKEKDIGGIHGRTEHKEITMNSRSGYEVNKMYFFHELTHALQTRELNGVEKCSFSNDKTGMFLVEGATQYTAEILYHVSAGYDSNIHYSYQNSAVRGQNNRTVYSPLDQYQYNGDIVMLLCKTIGITLPQFLSLGYREDAREKLNQLYDTMPYKARSFEDFMLNLEKIYFIDKIIINQGTSVFENTTVMVKPKGKIDDYKGNLEIEGNIMDQSERDLASMFIGNNNDEYILNNYQEILPYLTTEATKQNFMNAIDIIKSENNAVVQR